MKEIYIGKNKKENKNRMIKLIVSDVDGTLVKEGSPVINPEYYEVIRQLKEKGVTVAVASGRQLVSIRRLFAPVVDEIWMLGQNGNVIGHGTEQYVVKSVPSEWVKEFWNDLRQYEEIGVDVMANCGDCSYSPKEGTPMFQWIKDFYKYNIQALGGWDYDKTDEVGQITIYHPESAEKFCQDAHLFEKWGDRLCMMPTGETWVDSFMMGNGKGSAMKDICEKLNISLSEVAAFGDNLNDLDMVQSAGVGYAVESAREEVKAVADHVIPGVEEDGVLAVWKNILAELD